MFQTTPQTEFSKKKNNTTNTFNHQHQNFDYLGWFLKVQLILINNILVIVSGVTKKKKNLRH